MFIELHGAGFQNKGAELMLRTTVTELQHRLPQFLPAIDPTYGDFTDRSKLALHQIIPPRSHVGTQGFAKRFLKQRLFAKAKLLRIAGRVVGASPNIYGCVDLSGVGGLIDISGFAFTDQWGPQPTEDFAALTRYYKRQRKPIVLLPQAFGPFEHPRTRLAFAEVLENASLVYARDAQSRHNATELAANPEKIFQAPDITFFYSDYLTQSAETSLDGASRHACIVPNVRLLDQGKKQWGDNYKNYLALIAKELLALKIQVVLLVHDTSGGDLELAELIANELNHANVSIIKEDNPVNLKQVISQSLLLIGSRYHSLIAAFSNTVPSLAMGWSHKYDMLFKEFGCERYIIGPNYLPRTILELVNELVDPAINSDCRKRIACRLSAMRPINQAMWVKITDLLSVTVC